MLILNNYKKDMNELHDIVNSFFYEKNRDYKPSNLPINIYESEDKVYISVIASGIKKNDINIEYENKNLNINFSKKNSLLNDDKILRTERELGNFARTIELGTEIDPESIKASCENGIINISMDKKEYAKTKKIEIA